LQVFLGNGGTLITASHNMGVIRQLCSRAVWIEHGEVRAQGDLDGVVEKYLGVPALEVGLKPRE
jgi:ABC-type polysaccharide/polyol phosphate transport system ATPase subunit